MLPLAACAGMLPEFLDPRKNDYYDKNLELSREDYEHIARPPVGKNVPPADAGYNEPPIPELAPILAAPRPPKIGETQLVTLAVTDDVPLKDVLIELARLADVDIELDAGIQGGISFRAKEKPFNEVIERISDLAGLRYSMKNGVLRVERDTPYVQNYTLDFLNIDRSSTNSVNISTNVLSSSTSSSGGSTSGSSASGGGGAASGGLNTGSTSSIQSTSDADFWKALERSVTDILNYIPPTRVSETTLQAEFTPPDQAGGAGAAAAPSAPAQATPAPAPPADAAASSASGTRQFFIINRQAGIMTVAATQRQHEMIRDYIDRLRANASAQVLIEAKIVEVTLNDKFQNGIDWSFSRSNVGVDIDGDGDLDPVSASFGGVNPVDIANGIFTFNTTDSLGLNIDLSAAVTLAQEFGTTRTLSSPRLHAINNQQAVLTFAQNQVYFEIEVERETDTSGTTTQELFSVDSEIKTVPIGIILAMQPSINMESNEVTLNIRPTLSRVIQFVPDPAVAFLVAQAGPGVGDINNQIPVVEVRELDSILKLKSGQVMVIGGLMEQTGSNIETGVPYLSDVPFLGKAFKGTDDEQRNTELVIFIRATILGTSGGVSPADRTIYEKFTDDPRPIAF